MGYFLSFGLLYLGYCLVDWGHYIAKHEPVSLWWLMSGLGSRLTATSATSGMIDPPQPITGATAGKSIQNIYNDTLKKTAIGNSRMNA